MHATLVVLTKEARLRHFGHHTGVRQRTRLHVRPRWIYFLIFLWYGLIYCSNCISNAVWYCTIRCSLSISSSCPPLSSFFFPMIILGSNDNKVMVSLKINWDMVVAYISIFSFSEIMGCELAPTNFFFFKCKEYQPLGTINKQNMHKGFRHCKSTTVADDHHKFYFFIFYYIKSISTFKMLFFFCTPTVSFDN